MFPASVSPTLLMAGPATAYGHKCPPSEQSPLFVQCFVSSGRACAHCPGPIGIHQPSCVCVCVMLLRRGE